MLELKPLNIVFKTDRDIIYAVATQFQSKDFFCYHIYTPDKTFAIKPDQIASGRLKWTDLHGKENELYTLAGEAIEKYTTV